MNYKIEGNSTVEIYDDRGDYLGRVVNDPVVVEELEKAETEEDKEKVLEEATSYWL